jgi:hypothetical protein
MESRLVLADVLAAHEPGRDAFHRVPIFSGEFRDAVECVPTGLIGRFVGRAGVRASQIHLLMKVPWVDPEPERLRSSHQKFLEASGRQV